MLRLSGLLACGFLLLSCKREQVDYSKGYLVASIESGATGVLSPGDTLQELSPSAIPISVATTVARVARAIQAPSACARSFRHDSLMVIELQPFCGREPKDRDYMKPWGALLVDERGRIVDSGFQVAQVFGTVCPSGRDEDGRPYYYGGKWMLDGCERVRPERQTDTLILGVSTPLGVILPNAIRHGLLDQCSRSVPLRVDFEWTPTRTDIEEVERRLPAFIGRAAEGKLFAPLAGYGRQYGGFGVGSDSLIYINLWLRYPEDSSGYWRRRPVNACDGGHGFLGVVYDVQSHEFTRIDFNEAV